MTDILTTEQRKKNMNRVRSRDSSIEKAIRKGLHALGFRFRLCVKNLPGKPDVVLTKYHTIIFINGCFWHAHSCYRSKLPTTRADFWAKKLSENAARDKVNLKQLLDMGWRVAILWECSMRGKLRLDYCDILEDLTGFIFNNQLNYFEIIGRRRTS